MTYSQAGDLLGLRQAKKLTYNTTLRRDKDDFVVRLYQTDIVRICEDGTYVLNTGGFYTVTTKERINRYSPVSVYQHKGEWFLRDGTPFKDGVRIKLDGLVLLLG